MRKTIKIILVIFGILALGIDKLIFSFIQSMKPDSFNGSKLNRSTK